MQPDHGRAEESSSLTTDHYPLTTALLAGFPVVVEQRVAWGEMDAFRHVNNVVYFRYFENARLAYFERLGWPALQESTGVGPILASTQAGFRRALTYPDIIAIGARVIAVGKDRFTLEHHIVSHAQGLVTTDGQSVVVAYHYGEDRKAHLPEEIRRRIEELEKEGGRDVARPR
jgi:acyl-CoA thioester hydrolase